MNEPPPREVVRSKDFEDDAAFIEPELERFDEMFRGIEWVMARSPLLGRVVVRLSFGPNNRQVKVTALVTERQAILTASSTTKLTQTIADNYKPIALLPDCVQ